MCISGGPKVGQVLTLLLTRIVCGLQIKAGKDMAATSAHLWLEKNAFYKVPRALQDETVELNRRPFEEVSPHEWIVSRVRMALGLGGGGGHPDAVDVELYLRGGEQGGLHGSHQEVQTPHKKIIDI